MSKNYTAAPARAFMSALALSSLLLIGSIANADTIVTVNGKAIDNVVFETYAISRTRKPMAEVTTEERDALISELADIYLLSGVAKAAGMDKVPATAAQIELQTMGILAQNAVTDFVTKNPATEVEIKSEYDKQIKLAPAMQYKARHILVATQGEAAAIIKELDGGADFIELAKAKSTGPSGPDGGDLGWFSPGQMVAPFSSAVQALENGAYTKEAVQTEFGWHVIMREDSRATEPRTLESVHDVVKQNLEQGKVQAYIEELRSAAKIEK